MSSENCIGMSDPDIDQQFQSVDMSSVNNQNIYNMLQYEFTGNEKYFEKITDPKIIQRYLRSIYWKERCMALNTIQNQNTIYEFALADPKKEVRKHAIKKITSDRLLFSIALQEKEQDVRTLAISRIKNATLLHSLEIYSEQDKEYIENTILRIMVPA